MECESLVSSVEDRIKNVVMLRGEPFHITKHPWGKFLVEEGRVKQLEGVVSLRKNIVSYHSRFNSIIPACICDS